MKQKNMTDGLTIQTGNITSDLKITKLTIYSQWSYFLRT